jgi:hypothetical protein
LKDIYKDLYIYLGIDFSLYTDRYTFHILRVRDSEVYTIRDLFLFRPAITQKKKLALDTSSRDSFYSCPDLSSLQITSVPADFDSLDVRTDPSRSPSPSFEPAPHKKSSKARSVSRKARGVIGKVRAFHKVAAAKMAHPSIKIDTSVQPTKRGLPENDDAGLDVLGGDQDNPKLEVGNTEDIPPFLCQSASGGCRKMMREKYNIQVECD